jgi:hypothetical protein
MTSKVSNLLNSVLWFNDLTLMSLFTAPAAAFDCLLKKLTHTHLVGNAD